MQFLCKIPSILQYCTCFLFYLQDRARKTIFFTKLSSVQKILPTATQCVKNAETRIEVNWCASALLVIERLEGDWRLVRGKAFCYDCIYEYGIEVCGYYK